nr:ADP-heptose synthase [Salmonella sp. NCTC 7297]
MIVLGALESVDWVVSFEEDTPQRLIADILPDLLVKGGDYKPEEIAGSEEVWANGGEVMVLNFEDGCSTTQYHQKDPDREREVKPRHQHYRRCGR